MTRVVAVSHGYFGGEIREPGDAFDVPDDLWADRKRRPSWAKAAKGNDDDGDEFVALVEQPVATAAKAFSEMTVKELREYADEHSFDISGLTRKDDIIAAMSKDEAVERAGADPFADAPEPVRVENEANKLTGATEPDWVAPKPID